MVVHTVTITNTQVGMLRLLHEGFEVRDISKRLGVTDRAVRRFLASLRDGSFRANYEQLLEWIFEIEERGYLLEGRNLVALAWQTKRRKLREGFRPSGRPPFGYKFEQGRLVVNSEEAKTVKYIYNERIKGKSMFELGKETGLHRNVIRIVLRNPVYKGEVRHSGRVFTGKHEAIVSSETWKKAQAVRLAYRGPIPFGYKKGEGGRLQIEPDEAETVRRIYELRLDENSYGEIAKDVGLSASGVRSIVKNPVYAGMVKVKGEITLGEHERIISLKTWREAQKVCRLSVNHVRAIVEKLKGRGLDTRNRILDCLSEGPLGFLELSRKVGVSSSNVAVHLKRLKAQGLVDKKLGRYGKWHIKIGETIEKRENQRHV